MQSLRGHVEVSQGLAYLSAAVVMPRDSCFAPCVNFDRLQPGPDPMGNCCTRRTVVVDGAAAVVAHHHHRQKGQRCHQCLGTMADMDLRVLRARWGVSQAAAAVELGRAGYWQDRAVA